jgi:hypothetical protein
LTSIRTESGSDGTSDADPERARLARTIITPATTAQVMAQPGWFFRRQRIRAATPFMIAINV